MFVIILASLHRYFLEVVYTQILSSPTGFRPGIIDLFFSGVPLQGAHLELRGSFLTVSSTQYTALIKLHFCYKKCLNLYTLKLYQLT